MINNPKTEGITVTVWERLLQKQLWNQDIKVGDCKEYEPSVVVKCSFSG